MKLLICGDICVTPASFSSFNDIDEGCAFGDSLPIIKGADRAIINLECAITKSENRIKKFGPNLKAPAGTADTIKKAGFTDVMLSNNHVFDFGIEGLYDTLKELERCGLSYTGIGNDYEDSRKNYIIEHEGLRVCIVNVCEHEYSYATESRCGTRPFNEFDTMEDIRKAKADCDKVIVIYHGGKEYCRYPSQRLLKACREMVRCGADAVLCQHSHCIGSYENFEGAHILYGQGNFHFVSTCKWDNWNTGLAVCYDTKTGDIEFIPVKQREDLSGISLVEGDEKAAVLNKFKTLADTMKNGTW